MILPLLLALAFTPADAQFAYDHAGELVEKCTPRDPGTAGARKAARFIYDEAAKIGAKPSLESFRAATPRGRRSFANVWAEWEVCPTGSWVVVVSHFDTKPGTDCPGANDGASTCGILLALARRFVQEPPPANIQLMWLDGEESMKAYTDDDGFWGSKHAARRLAESGRSVKGVICLDMLGDRDLEISIPRNSSPRLRAIAHLASAAAGIDCPVMDMPELIKDDHIAFLREGFDAIDLIDFEYSSAPGENDYWHTSADTMDKLSTASLLSAGCLALEMINLLSASQSAR